MDQGYNLYNIEPKFKSFLNAGNISTDTLKNYLSDIRHFSGWLLNHTRAKNQIEDLINLLSSDLVEEYKTYLIISKVPVITVNRRLSSLRKFFDFLVEESVIPKNTAREVPNIQRNPKINRIKPEPVLDMSSFKKLSHFTSAISETSLFLKRFFPLKLSIKSVLSAVAVIFIMCSSSLILVKKDIQYTNSKPSSMKDMKRARILTFKGKLLDSIGNPVSSKTDVAFKIYAEKHSDNPIYTGLCKGVNGVTPEVDGMAMVVIGKDCDMEPIPQSVFSENPGLYLGVTIGSDKELIPRQQIANVSYALDSEKLQGLGIGNKPNSIPYVDENGTINIEASESSIISNSLDGLFTIGSEGTLSLQSGDQGDITLTSGLSGSLKFKTGGFSDSISNLFIGSEGNIGIGTEDPSNFKVQVNGDIGPEGDDMFNLGSTNNQWANVYSTKFLQNGVALCDQEGNNCPTNISSWLLSSPYLYTNQKNIRVGIGTLDPASIISKLYVTKDINDAATGKALTIFDQTENQDIIAASASGQTRFVVKNNGNTGIGTVNPSTRLDVSGGQTKIELSTQYTERLCHSGLDTSLTQNALLGDCSSGGADIAEFYASTDKTIEPGDVVIAKTGAEMVGKDSKAYADKSTKAYDTRVIGIVSTNPYESFGKSFNPNEYIFPVALSGRVPVKISKGSDVIKAGDLITSSKENGKAMKATQEGPIIGKALEDWSADMNKNTILVLVNLSWSDPSLLISSSGELLSSQKSAYVYNGLIEKETNQRSIFNNLMLRASEEEKNLLLILWQSKDSAAEKTGGLLDISYSMAQNSLENTALKIQNLLVSKKITSPIVETTDIIATGSSRLYEIHTNSIKTDGDNIQLDLGNSPSSTESATTGPLAELIIKGVNGRRAASIDSAGNATFSGNLVAKSASISGDASISGTLVAKEIQSDTIMALEQRINSLADSSKQNSDLLASASANFASATNSATVASNSNSFYASNKTESTSIHTEEIEKLIAQLKSDTLANPKYYHIPDTIDKSSTTISNSPTISLQDQMEKLKLENLTVTGNANFYTVNAAESITIGNMVIQNNTILSLANNLNISALSTISLFDGAVTIAKDGTMTTKGAIIARSGIKTNTIEAVDKNVVVKLATNVVDRHDNSDTQSKLIIANAKGTEVASINASGSAQFDEISLNKYMDATDTASLISAKDNFEKHGVFAPAFDADKKTAGNGVMPLNSSEVMIYTDKVKEGSLIYLTPSDQIIEGQMSILEKHTCADSTDSSCRPYFRVGISKAEHPDLNFDWLIIN